MAIINIESISDLDLNGNDLFQDSESFITELDDEGEFIVGGYRRRGNLGGRFCGVSGNFCGVTGAIFNCGNTFCGNTIGFCGQTVVGCGNTIGNR